MMKVAIVDDEPLAREAVRLLVQHDPELAVVAECSGVDAVAAIEEQRPDILFLDIQMPEVDGFDVLERAGFNAVPAVVFVTAYDQYALRAFEVNALDYLLKPFDNSRFYAALLRAKERVRARAGGGKWVRRFLVRAREKILFIKSDDIDWVEAADYYVSLHVGGRSHLLRETMSAIEKQLDPDRFVRIHRGAIVNLDRVKEMHRLFRGDCTITLESGAQLRLSRAHREEFERRLTRRE
jgi:two-component system LytT family response regulator